MRPDTNVAAGTRAQSQSCLLYMTCMSHVSWQVIGRVVDGLKAVKAMGRAEVARSKLSNVSFLPNFLYAIRAPSVLEFAVRVGRSLFTQRALETRTENTVAGTVQFHDASQRRLALKPEHAGSRIHLSTTHDRHT